MTPAPEWRLAAVLLITMMGVPAGAQITQFLPEVDVYSGLSGNTQFWFQAKQTREDGAPTQAEIGPSFNFFVKPLLKLKTSTVFDLDDSKKRLLVISAGYRYLPSPNAQPQNQILLMATSNVPVKGGLLISDRNRLEINFTNDNPSWRYRNWITLEKSIAIGSYHPSPYAAAEFYYNSRYDRRYDHTLRGLYFSAGPENRTRTVLPTRKQHRRQSQSAGQWAWIDAESVFQARRKMKPISG